MSRLDFPSYHLQNAFWNEHSRKHKQQRRIRGPAHDQRGGATASCSQIGLRHLDPRQMAHMGEVNLFLPQDHPSLRCLCSLTIDNTEASFDFLSSVYCVRPATRVEEHMTRPRSERLRHRPSRPKSRPEFRTRAEFVIPEKQRGDTREAHLKDAVSGLKE